MTLSAPGRLDDDIISRLTQAILNESAAQQNSHDFDLTPLADKLALELTASLRRIVADSDCAAGVAERSRFSVFPSDQQPAAFVFAREEDQPGFVLFRLGAETVDWWCAAALGGPRATAPGSKRPVSVMEARIARVVVDHAIGALRKVLSECDVEFSLQDRRVCINAGGFPKIHGDPVGHVFPIQLAGDGSPYKIDIFITEDLGREWAAATRSLITETTGPMEQVLQDTGWLEGMETRVSSVAIGVEAVLSSEVIELDEIASWVSGSVITLSATTGSAVQLTSNGVPLFAGELGKMNGQLCVQIIGAIEADGIADLDGNLPVSF